MSKVEEEGGVVFKGGYEVQFKQGLSKYGLSEIKGVNPSL